MRDTKKQLLKDMGFGKQVSRINKGRCATCGNGVNKKHFKDEVSRREYEISGMCQKCQDKMFD